MSIIKLVEIKQLSGTIEILTGLHIGGGDDEIHIGGVDNTVVRNPLTKEPYIPGSSLKGKIRSLIEVATNRVSSGPWATEDGDDPVARIFGNGAVKDNYDGGPTRVYFRDCPLLNGRELREREALTEVKAEVSIDRIRGTAGGGGPRHTERVCQGAKFDFALSYKVFYCGDGGQGDGGQADRDNFKLLLLGLKLLEGDALGGSGSRGYGRLHFVDLKPVGLEGLDLDELKAFERNE